MPPLIRNNKLRHLDMMIAGPARTARAVATGQQIGTSGPIPGTSAANAPAGTSGQNQLATLQGTIQQYPTDTSGNPQPSPNGDTIAGVGHQVLNKAGNPVVVMGNLNAAQTSGTDLPSSFQDGGFAFVDAEGNLPAGYSQKTGLWGFSEPLMIEGANNSAPAQTLYVAANIIDLGNGVVVLGVSGATAPAEPPSVWGDSDGTVGIDSSSSHADSTGTVRSGSQGSHADSIGYINHGALNSHADSVGYIGTGVIASHAVAAGSVMGNTPYGVPASGSVALGGTVYTSNSIAMLGGMSSQEGELAIASESILYSSKDNATIATGEPLMFSSPTGASVPYVDLSLYAVAYMWPNAVPAGLTTVFQFDLRLVYTPASTGGTGIQMRGAINLAGGTGGTATLIGTPTKEIWDNIGGDVAIGLSGSQLSFTCSYSSAESVQVSGRLSLVYAVAGA